jgi:drug/metabolite transporter (DMT)-like permease
MASAAEQLCGGAVILAAALVRGERLHAIPAARPLLAWGYLVVFGSLLAFSAYVWLLRHVRPALATSYAYVNPAVAVLLGALAGEAVPPRALVALALVVAGVVIVASRPRS